MRRWPRGSGLCGALSRSRPRILNRCGHVPVELDWRQGEFFDGSGLYLICATHGALYAPDSGRCLGGRCNGKGLEPVAVVEEDGWIVLTEEGGQGVG
jgi:nitrite reductase/ring-hydroxylating ferredoxin subunit